MIQMTPAQVEEAVSLIATNQQGKGKSLRAFRERAGLSQRELAARFHKAPATICGWETEDSWPSPGILIRMLENLGVESSLILSKFAIERDGDLDRKLYIGADASVIEHQWFLKTRGTVLQAIYDRAIEGSDNAAKLYWELLGRNEDRYSKLQNTPRLVSDSTASWTTQSMQVSTRKVLKTPETPAKEPISVTPQVTDNSD